MYGFFAYGTRILHFKTIFPFEDASTLTISVPQRFQENTVYSFSFWKEFGLTLPKDPGNYQVEWKSFRERDWQVIATFTLEAMRVYN